MEPSVRPGTRNLISRAAQIFLLNTDMQNRRVRKPQIAGKILTYAEFKSVFGASELQIPERSLRKSYRGLNALRKNQTLSWNEVREKVQQLVNSLNTELFESRGKFSAVSIPLTARDWDRIG